MLRSFLANRSLRQKLMFSFIILVLLPLSTISVLSYQIFRASLFDKVSTSTTEVLRQTSNNIDNYLRQLDDMTLRPYYDQNLLNILTAIKKNSLNPNDEYTLNNVTYSYNTYLTTLFKQMMLSHHDIEGIFLYPLSGPALFAASHEVLNANFDVTRASWYPQAVRDKGQLVLTAAYVQEQIGYQPARVFTMARVVNDFATRQPLGTFAVDVNFAELGKISQDVKLFENSRLGIYTANGEEVLSGGGNQSRLVSEYLDLAARKFRIVDGYWVTSYTSSYSGWMVFYQVPLHVLNKQIDTIKTYILVTALCGLLLASVFYGSIVFRLTNPLLQLRRMMSRVGGGDFPLQMPKHEVKDEIGQLTAHFVKMTHRLQETIDATHVLSFKRKQAQLNALRMQMNPHFLYNTLESIYMVAIMNEDEEAARMIGYLGDFFKKTLHQSSDFIRIRDELENFQVYWQLQSVRFAGQVQVELDVPEALADAYTVPLILQPLVENAIQHGLRANAGRIGIRIFKEDRRLFVQVSNTGKLVSEELLLRMKSLASGEAQRTSERMHTGLRNLQERIVLLCGERERLQFDRLPEGGLRVGISLPFREDKEPEGS